MKRRKQSKKALVLFIILSVILTAAVVVLGFLCCLSFDLNQDMKQHSEEIKAENEMLTAKISELELQLEEMEALAKQQTSQNDPQDNAMPDSIDSLSIGQIVDEFQVIGSEVQYFKAYEIAEGDSVYNRINGKSYYANDNIGLSDLRYLKMAHYNFEHQVQIGEMIVNAAISEDVLSLFRELFDMEYEIQSMRLIDDYWTGDGDSSDSNSIEHNNTSAFCYRQVTGGGGLSNHAFGRAIDINPQQNPYVWYTNGQPQWSHENASPYIDRSIEDPHVIKEGDKCYNAFSKYGFGWGGLWNGIKDYQHFEKE